MSINSVVLIAQDKLQPHPRNPRIVMRDDVVEAIAANLVNGFDPAHALIVRPLGDSGFYEVISGHHRRAAAFKADISELPCWVRDMSDEDAYMALATSNSQGELSPLEIGLHALNCVGLSEGGRGKKGGLSAYAAQLGKAKQNISMYKQAADVALNCHNDMTVLHDKSAHLSAIHALPAELWPQAVKHMRAWMTC